MSEESDAVVVIVSEETGTVSIAIDGKLIRGLRDDTLRARLTDLLQIGERKSRISSQKLGQVATRVGDAIKTGAKKTTRKKEHDKTAS